MEGARTNEINAPGSAQQRAHDNARKKQQACSETVLHEESSAHAANGKQRADRNIDLCNNHNKRHTGGDQKNRKIGQRQVSEVSGRVERLERRRR